MACFDATFYQKLQNAFCTVRDLHRENAVHPGKKEGAVGDLRFAAKQLEKKASGREKRLLLYCIDTQLEILTEGNSEKIADFADTAQLFPEIFLGLRNYYSLLDEMRAFRQKYGERYFKDMNKIYPRFTARAPKNYMFFFLPNSDDAFKKQHPVGYGFLMALGITVLFAPMIAYIAVFISIGEKGNWGWAPLGWVGAFAMGIGFFNLVAAIIQQYLGHALTVGCIAGGGCAVALSLLLMYQEPFSGFFSFELTTYCLMSQGLLTLPALLYLPFRHALGRWLRERKELSGKKIDALTDGAKNFWFLSALQREVGLGAIYYLNGAFVLLLPAAGALSGLLGLFKPASLVLTPLNVLVTLFSAAMVAFTHAQYNLSNYGTPIVLWRKNRHRGFDSILFDLGAVLFVLACAWCHVALLANLWQFPLPRLPWADAANAAAYLL